MACGHFISVRGPPSFASLTHAADDDDDDDDSWARFLPCFFFIFVADSSPHGAFSPSRHCALRPLPCGRRPAAAGGALPDEYNGTVSSPTPPPLPPLLLLLLLLLLPAPIATPASASVGAAMCISVDSRERESTSSCEMPSSLHRSWIELSAPLQYVVVGTRRQTAKHVKVRGGRGVK